MSVPPQVRLRVAGLHSRLAGPFDLTVDKGECIAIAGPSGSGKSLLLRMIADLDPSSGEVWLDGRDRHDFPAPVWPTSATVSPGVMVKDTPAMASPAVFASTSTPSSVDPAP